MKQKLQKILGIGSVLLLVALSAQAQRKSAKANTKPKVPVQVTKESPDTSAPKTVTVTSAFKPFLKNAAKLNFTAATPIADSSKIPVTYQVPSQNLFFSYQPVAIKPLALPADSGYTWENHQYIKLGAGNFSSYVAEAGFSFGDGRNSITNIKGNFLTSTGHMFAQQASRWGVDILSMFSGGQDDEWTAHAFYNTQTQYYYGLNSSSPSYLKEDLLRQYNTVGIELGMRTKMANSFGITYHPQISFVRIADNNEANGMDFVIKAPISKSFGKIYAFNLGLTADMSTANMPSVPATIRITNNLYYLNPSISFKTPNLKINAGIQPSWDNKQFSMLPDITAEAKLSDASLVFEAGWKGYFQKNTFRSLAMFNPWIENPTGLSNTRIREQFAGVKGGTGSHFTFQGRFSLLNFDNHPLFLNNPADGKSFIVVYEPSMKAVRIHGELGYTVQEKFSFMSGVTFTQYNSLSVNEKPWGLLPLELTGSAKWRPLKDLQLKADVFAWDGAAYRAAGLLGTRKADPAADLNFGAEFTVVPKLNLWVQMNNLLNSTYQRWNQYPVLGFNVTGGIVYSFR